MKNKYIFIIILFLGSLVIVSKDFGQVPVKLNESQCDLSIDDEEHLQMQLQIAVSKNDIKCVEILLVKGVNPNSNRKDKTLLSAPIFTAAFNGKIEIIKLLLKAGLDVKSKDVNYALLMAVQNGHLEVVKLFLDAGVDVNGTLISEGRILRTASKNGHVEIVEILLSRKAEVNAPSEEGITSLMEAADKPQIINSLIKAGANLEAVDNEGRTAIFYAIKDVQMRKFEILLKNGANTKLPDKNGITPMKLAQKISKLKERRKVIALLSKFESN